jgi:enoyl-CoA hydratase/carnithine racemase
MDAMTTPLGQVGSLAIADGVALLRIDSPPVNALGHAVRCALVDGLQAALAAPQVQAIVVCCAGRTFFAGADISELGKPIQPPLLGDIIRLIEGAAKPVVFAMHGTALGGGFELALAGHYRVATRSARLGLPEVALGLLPGAGGTQRLPRLAGAARALDMMLFARQLAADEALRAGIVDAVVADDAMEQGALAFARELAARGAPLRRVRDLPVDLAPDAVRQMGADIRARHPELFHGFRAPGAVLQAVEAAASLTLDEGLGAEAALSRELLASPESAAQRHIFFAERAAAKLQGVAPGTSARKARTVAVSGTQAQVVVDWLDKQGVQARHGATADADLLLQAGDGDAAQDDRVAIRIHGAAQEVTLAELARLPGTTDETMATALALVRKHARAAVVVRSAGAGLAASLLEAGRTEADRLAGEGAARAALYVALHAFGFPPGTAGQIAGADAPEGAQAAGEAELRRVLDAMAGRAERLVAEDAVAQPADLDVASVYALGWPRYKGGILYWASRGRPGRQEQHKEKAA